MSRQAEYRRSDAQLYGAFKFPTLKNDDAAFLASLLDDCLFAGLLALDLTDYARRAYGKFVVQAIFRGKLKSLSTVGDHYYYTTLPAMQNDNWLSLVREHVSPIRELLFNLLGMFIKRYTRVQSLGRATDNHALDLVHDVEDKLDCQHDTLYGIIAEIQYQLDRTKGIVERMARPYLRRVVSLSKNYANEPEAFFENYQNGYYGVLTAIGKYDSRFGAFAFMVDLWIRNKMIAGITRSSNSFTLPDRVWKHKRLVEHHAGKDLDEVARLEGVSEDLLRNSMHLLDVRNASQIIEETDEDFDGLEAYHDRQSETEQQEDMFKEQIRVLAKHLTSRQRIVLSINFDIDLYDDDSDPADIRLEAARQLFCATHF